MSRRNQIDMLNGPLLKRMTFFAVPIMLTSTLQQLFNTVDIAIVGQFAGSEAMAAVGSNGAIVSLILNLLLGMSIGSNVVIANYIGQGRRDRVKATVHTSVLIAIIGGLLFGLIGLLIARPLLTAMDSPADVIDMATLYLRIFFCGIPLLAVYNFCASILRSKGDTLRPLICLAVSGVVKVGLNFLFVGGLHWSVKGTGIASVIANALSAGMLLWLLIHEKDEFRLDLRKLKMHKEHLIRILRIGLPSGLQGMVFSLSNVFIQAAINGFGSQAVAGSAAAMNFEYFAYFVLNAFVQTTMTFTSQNYGAREMKRCRKIFLIGMILSVLATMLCDTGFYLGREALIGFFTSVPAVAEWAYIRMKHILLLQFLANSYEITSGALRGMGHSALPALITVLGTCVLRIFWVFAVFGDSSDFAMLMDIYPITWAVTGVAVLTAYFIVRHKEERRCGL